MASVPEKFASPALRIAVLGCLALAAARVRATDLTLKSPKGQLELHVSDAGNKLTYDITLGGTKVVEPSNLNFSIDGKDLCSGATIATDDVTAGAESFPTRGLHGQANVSWKGATLHLSTGCTLEWRAYDDGVAFRFVADGAAGQSRTPDELTEFRVPAGSTVWSHDLSGHYEGTYKSQSSDAFPASTWAAPPMTFRLPNGGGYASVMEANLVNYSGMALECVGSSTFRLGLAHRQPVSHPYELRYSKEDVARLSQPAKINGAITTPWRVVLAAKDLNTLVNSDLITALSPPPDPKFFPQGYDTPWVRTGRAVWRYLDNVDAPQDPALEPKKPATPPQTGTPAAGATAVRKAVPLSEAKNWTKMAADLGFEFNILEGFWRNYSDADLRELVDDANRQHVGIFVWLHSKDLHDPAHRHEVFDRLAGLGIAGMKIDFFDHEHKETIDLYHDILRESAERRLLVDFHGANKPTGEERTWPNEVVREAIRGMEARSLKERAFHETTLPFTRFLAGPAEYTGLLFNARRGDTSVAHQIGVPIVFTAPLLTYGAHPANIEKSPALDLIKSVPSTWDETIVLPGSEIGELAAFARRKGTTWFVAVLNGPAAKDIELPLTFLKAANYTELSVSDAGKDDVKVDATPLNSPTSIHLALQPGGGFVARFTEANGAK